MSADLGLLPRDLPFIFWNSTLALSNYDRGSGVNELNRDLSTISMVPEQMDVRIYGDTAVMIIRLRSREQAPDRKTTDNLGLATKVFVRRHGQWDLAHLVGSPLNQ